MYMGAVTRPGFAGAIGAATCELWNGFPARYGMPDGMKLLHICIASSTDTLMSSGNPSHKSTGANAASGTVQINHSHIIIIIIIIIIIF